MTTSAIDEPVTAERDTFSLSGVRASLRWAWPAVTVVVLSIAVWQIYVEVSGIRPQVLRGLGGQPAHMLAKTLLLQTGLLSLSKPTYLV